MVGLDVGGIGSQWKQFRNIANYTQTMAGMPPPPMPGMTGGMSPMSDAGGAPLMPDAGMGAPPIGMPPPMGPPEIMAGNSGIFKSWTVENF